jgi:catalase
MLSGAFTPSPEAVSLTRAPHLTRDSTPVILRFSNSTGFPLIPDNAPDANPRGLAIRFHLADHVHTDIVSHSTDGFPTRTGQEFLDLLRAAAAGDPSTFLATHPAALAFAQTPKPNPTSFAKETYFGVTAFRFINQHGLARYGRYRIVPDAGVEHLDDATAKSKDANYLFEELTHRIAAGPSGSTSTYRPQMTWTSWMTLRSTGLPIGRWFISAPSRSRRKLPMTNSIVG